MNFIAGEPSWRDRISAKPEVMHGQTCIKGTRIPVSVVLDNLAGGLSAEQIVALYPSLTVEDVRAALSYAADISKERVLHVSDARHAG